jgi:hypothetical protein
LHNVPPWPNLHPRGLQRLNGSQHATQNSRSRFEQISRRRKSLTGLVATGGIALGAQPIETAIKF